MGYQVFPQPSTSGASLPPGATSRIFGGVARKGGFTYTTTSLSSGPKMVYVNGGAGKVFVAYGQSNNLGSIVPNANYGILNFSTTETSLSIRDVGSFSGEQFVPFSSGIGYKTLFSTSLGYLFLTVGSPTILGVTTNFTSWTTRASFGGNGGTQSSVFGQIVGAPGKYLAQNGNTNTGVPLLFSTDGINWTSRDRVYQSSSYLAYNGTFFILKQTGGAIAVSTDGLNWTTSATQQSISVGVLGIQSGNGFFFSPGGFNQKQTVYFSTNGINWSTATTPGPSATTGYYSAISYGNGIFVASGTDSSSWPIIAISTNLSTWSYSRVTATTGTGLGYVQYSNGVFYANWSGQGNDKYVSIDGVNWTTTNSVQGDFTFDMGSDGNRSYFFLDSSSRDSSNSVQDGFFFTGNNSAPYIEVYNMSDTNLN